ncbi:MAG TPA: helix-turn-helix domain-containing protein [Rhodanobacteraceae bacterium]|nr:helix-turn-helix domain-containing protein [Rhodanobacteraceae bacterium]
MSSAIRQHELIKAGLRLRGTSFAEIARRLDVAPTTVTIVSQGHRRSRRIEAAIAQALDVALERLWPDRYPTNHPVTDPDAGGALLGR